MDNEDSYFIMRKRSYYSKKMELLKKSKEAALAAIQIYNNPQVTFKSESFIVLMIIAWTYLLHAYYKANGIDYRYTLKKQKPNRYVKTKHGAFKYWDLSECLKSAFCPLEQPVKDNLTFLIEIRNEIEHQMTGPIDLRISAKFQACCINYNAMLKSLTSNNNGLEESVPIALQLFSFGENQIETLKNVPDLPSNLIDFVSNFESNIQSINEPQYSYRVFYTRNSVNHSKQADVAYTFIPEESQDGREIHNILIKNRNPKKVPERSIVASIQQEGYPKFSKHDHQKFWKLRWPNATIRNNNAKAFGELIMNNQWLWYEKEWLREVLAYCETKRADFC